MRLVLATVVLIGGIVAGLVSVAATPAGEPSGAIGPPAGGPPTSIESTTIPALPPLTIPLDIVPDPTVPRQVPQPANQRLPEDLVNALESQLADPRLVGLDVSVSVWMDDYGVILTHNPELALYPASNQKLLTGVGALGLLPADFRFTTEIAVSDDDLVVVAGGDPTLTTADLHRLSQAVVDAGVVEVGQLLVDATRYDSARMAPGWQDWQMPTYVGPLSTFIVDDNRHRTDADYLKEPDLGNAELLRAALEHSGVRVTGPTVLQERPPEARTVATIDSAERDELVARLLTRSDNEIAEALVREVGFRTSGLGSTPAGLAAIEDYAATLGTSLTGRSGDGSGLSRANLRSAADWTQLLTRAMETDWWPTFYSSLAVAGRTGTLAGRLGGDATAGNVRAKTGSIIGGRSLSGLLEDRSGRLVVFSFVVNGRSAGAAIPVMDRFVEILAQHE